jgi:hypothetical protein
MSGLTRIGRDLQEWRDSVIHTLATLDAIAQADRTEESFAPDARVWGAQIAGCGVVVAAAMIAGIAGAGSGLDPASVAFLIVGAGLPGALAFLGGARLALGDPRGKRRVVYAIALGYLYLVYWLIAMPMTWCPDFCGVVRLWDLMFGIPVFGAMAYLLYRFVASLRYGGASRGHGRILSAILGVIAFATLVSSALAPVS